METDRPPPRPPSPDDEVLVDVEVEVPRGGFVKRVGSGQVDFISPLPCPFNYGAIPATTAEDGDRLDVVLLGPRLPRGTRTRSAVRAVVRFLDAGAVDDKLVCSSTPLTESDRRLVKGFFAAYALAKRGLNTLRGKTGTTEVLGWDEPVPSHMLPVAR